MKNENHLTFEDCLNLYFLPEDHGELRQHLDRCPECLERFHSAQQDLCNQAAQFRRQVDHLTDNFWETQRHQILWRIRAGERTGSGWNILDLRTWATAAAILVFSVALTQWTWSPRTPISPTEKATIIQDLKDDRLLRELNHAINQDQAGPLQPLDLLLKVPDSLGENADREHFHEIS